MKVEGKIEMEKIKKKKHQNNYSKIIQILDYTKYQKQS
jgi:hypothetical protein